MALPHDVPAAPAPRRGSPSRRRHPLRLLISLVILLMMLAAGVLGWEGWSYSSSLLAAAPHHPTYSTRVVVVHGNTVTLTRTSTSARPGTWGLTWQGGHATVGPVIWKNQSVVARRLVGAAAGSRPGRLVDFDVSPYMSPVDLHLRYRTVSVVSPLGPMPTWYIPGHSGTWAILVHGWRGDQADCLRAVPTLAGLGLPILDITYRNDPGAPASPDHLYHLGASEWQDLQASARYALHHGAKSIVLYGYSMGANIVESFLHHSALANRVRSVVLDAPALDWSAVIDWEAKQSKLPSFFKAIELPIIKQFVAWRIGLPSLEAINQVRAADSLKVRTLIFHGKADTRVPFSTSAALAQTHPNLVTYVPVPGAGHIASWNVNPARYKATLRTFLTMSPDGKSAASSTG